MSEYKYLTNRIKKLFKDLKVEPTDKNAEIFRIYHEDMTRKVRKVISKEILED